MNWKEFKVPVEVTDNEGIKTTTEEVSEYFCKQDWLDNSNYSIKKIGDLWRGCFNFKDSEAYIHTHRDLERVKTFCQNHLDSIIKKINT